MASAPPLQHSEHALFAFRGREVAPRHRAEVTHAEHGLTFLLDGWIELDSAGAARAEAGSFVIVPAGVPHRLLDGADVEYWLVGFCASCLELDDRQLLMEPFHRVRGGAVPVAPAPSERRQRILQHLRGLEEECARAAPDAPAMARCHLLLLLGELRRAMPRVTSDLPSGSLVADALAFIQRRALEPISLRDVAAAVHRTPAHVTTAVRRATGHPVGDWITAARVSEVARRLLHTDESLDEIAGRVGWSDKTHLIRQFRRAYGQTPAAWRRQHRA